MNAPSANAATATETPLGATPDAERSMADVDVLIITFNERLNLPHCLEAVRGWARRVFVIDSGSTDGTQELARSLGAEVVEHAWEGYAAQKNWALSNLPLEASWVLIVDADEVITPELRARIEAAVAPSGKTDSIERNGFFINRLTYFLGEPIRHCGFYPSWNLRLFRRGKGHYEDRLVHEHVILPDPVGYLDESMLHYDRRGLEHFYAKHNRYSTLEAQQLFQEILHPEVREQEQANVSADARRRRWLKRHVTRWVPLPSLWRFFYMFVLRLGFLDGRVGYRFCRFIASYDGMVAFKLRTLLHQHRDHRRRDSLGSGFGGLATREGNLTDPIGESEDVSPPSPWDAKKSESPRATEASLNPPTQMQPESSPWSFSGKLARAVWMLAGKPLFRCSFHNWYLYRRLLLRLFGATIAKGVAIRPSVSIEIPWMLEIDENATIGDHAILYSLGKIRIGKRAIISQYAHLCAGTHDYTDRSFKLLRTPITIEDDVWIGADAFVGPGVRVERLAVLGARSSAYRDLPARQVSVGNPARPVKERVLK